MSFSVDGLPDDAGLSFTQVLYRSRSVASVQSGMQMSDILDEARAGNARDHITGVLTSVGGFFVQIIEGPEPQIDALMKKLGKDARHTDLEVLERRVVARRLFGDWDMVSPVLAPLEVATLGLLFATPGAGIDDYAAILSAAVAKQEDMLEGRRSGDLGERHAAGPHDVTQLPVDRQPRS